MNKLIVLVILITTAFACNNVPKQVEKPGFGENTVSLILLNKLILKDSLNPKHFANRAELLLKLGKIDPALRDLQAALKLTPNDPKLFLILSDIYFVLGQSDNSIGSLKKSIRLNPKDETPYLKLSETYLLLNKPNTAIQYADEAININRKNAESYYIKAMALLENKDTSEAILNLGISSNLDAENYMTYMQLGAIYTKQNDTLSRVNFEKALDIVPNDERALYYLGMYYQEHSDFNKAIEIYTTLYNQYPDNKRVYYNLGYIYLVEVGDYDNAKTMFQEAIKISPKYVEAVYNLGRTLEVMGDFKGAREQYKKALELLPNYPLAVQGMNRIDDRLINGN
jgi:tetratricopeptide (TPR) repeat protein